MFILKNVTDEHVNKWVVTKAGSDIIVAYDTDLEEALKKAQTAGVEQPNASIVFVYPEAMSLIFTTSQREKDIQRILGDQRKCVSLPIDQSFLG